mmetsp:Transcript_58168/g.189543  ORF Transcript_58168/g.189543 Transcript_58168/m.189543 type:complete len:257 (-) Transcript_58168:164-934(-)
MHSSFSARVDTHDVLCGYEDRGLRQEEHADPQWVQGALFHAAVGLEPLARAELRVRLLQAGHAEPCGQNLSQRGVLRLARGASVGRRGWHCGGEAGGQGIIPVLPCAGLGNQSTRARKWLSAVGTDDDASEGLLPYLQRRAQRQNQKVSSGRSANLAVVVRLRKPHGVPHVTPRYRRMRSAGSRGLRAGGSQDDTRPAQHNVEAAPRRLQREVAQREQRCVVSGTGRGSWTWRLERASRRRSRLQKLCRRPAVAAE